MLFLNCVKPKPLIILKYVKKKKKIVIIIIMIINYLLSNLLKYVTSVIYSKPNPDLFLNITK